MATLDVLVKPRSSSDRVRINDTGVVTVAVCAPPVDGEANERVIRVLAKALGIGRTAIQITRGVSSRRKTVTIDCLSVQDALRRLAEPTG